MSEDPPRGQRARLDIALVDLGRSDPNLSVLDADYGRPTRETPFARTFPTRFEDVSTSDPSTARTAARLASEGRSVVAWGLAALIAGQGYPVIRESIARTHARVRFLSDPVTPWPELEGAAEPMVEDLGIVRGLPGMTVLCPADPASSASALRAAATVDGPVYVRLVRDEAADVTDGAVEIGRAREVRSGGDLTLGAIGGAVARALEVADALARVGVSVRVLDLASVKPLDVKSILRAARETGAILTLEEHSALTGVGSLVAACTSEEYPVPVRRMGAPDLFPGSGTAPEHDDPYGLALDHCLEEAYELLRARGKVQ